MFSGNGQYARSIVRGLKAEDLQVMVLSGRKANVPMEQQDAEARSHAAAPHSVIDIPLQTWGRLDRKCGWQEFAAASGGVDVASAVAHFEPQAVMFVDWSALPAWQSLQQTFLKSVHTVSLASIPSVYLNFRIFTTSTALHEVPPTLNDGVHANTPSGAVWPAIAPESDLSFYQRMEATAVNCSSRTVALCRLDALHLAALACGCDPNTGDAILGASDNCHHSTDAGRSASPTANGHGRCNGRWQDLDIRIVLPPLRSDIQALSSTRVTGSDRVGGSTGTEAPSAGPDEAHDWSQQRLGPAPAAGTRLLTSVVRLSPEKGAHRFAKLITRLSSTSNPDNSCEPAGASHCDERTPIMARCRLQACLCGSAPDPEYARSVREVLVAAAAGGSAGSVSQPSATTASTINTATTPSSSSPASSGATVDLPPAILPTSFLGPADMAAIFSRSVANVHGALADAYGMTIVEAAAFGCPSIVHVPGASAVGDCNGDDDASVRMMHEQQLKSLFASLSIGSDAATGSAATAPHFDGGAAAQPQQTADTLSVVGTGTDAQCVAGSGNVSNGAMCLHLRNLRLPPPARCMSPDPTANSGTADALVLDSSPGADDGLDTGADAAAVGRHLVRLSRSLPPVGACDLLAPNPSKDAALLLSALKTSSIHELGASASVINTSHPSNAAADAVAGPSGAACGAAAAAEPEAGAVPAVIPIDLTSDLERVAAVVGALLIDDALVRAYNAKHTFGIAESDRGSADCTARGDPQAEAAARSFASAAGSARAPSSAAKDSTSSGPRQSILQRIATAAKLKALAWKESDNGAALAGIVRELVSAHTPKR